MTGSLSPGTGMGGEPPLFSSPSVLSSREFLQLYLQISRHFVLSLPLPPPRAVPFSSSLY